jgi:hypothetical protein
VAGWGKRGIHLRDKLTRTLAPYLTDTDSWYIFPEYERYARRFRTDWRFRWHIRWGRIRAWWEARPLPGSYEWKNY